MNIHNSSSAKTFYSFRMLGSPSLTSCAISAPTSWTQESLECISTTVELGELAGGCTYMCVKNFSSEAVRGEEDIFTCFLLLCLAKVQSSTRRVHEKSTRQTWKEYKMKQFFIHIFFLHCFCMLKNVTMRWNKKKESMEMFFNSVELLSPFILNAFLGGWRN